MHVVRIVALRNPSSQLMNSIWTLVLWDETLLKYWLQMSVPAISSVDKRGGANPHHPYRLGATFKRATPVLSGPHPQSLN